MNFTIPKYADGSAICALGGADSAGRKTAGDLMRDANALSFALRQALSQNGTNGTDCSGIPEVLVICADRYHFAVCLLACWMAGATAALPPNGQQATVHELASRRGISLILHDTDRDTEGHPALDVRQVIGTDHIQSAQNGDFCPLSIDGQRTIAALYTSGSTGEHKRCPKTAIELLGEAKSHVESFAIPPGEVFAATVPGHHIYGLIWSVLVPLLSGGVLDRMTTLFPEAVVRHARDIGATYLISVPAHLRALAEVDEMPRLKRITSSSAPLPPETARKIFEKFHIGVTEIFGSSETGGIAFREEPGAPHRPLSGVKVFCGDEGRLMLDSPFMSPDLPRPVPCDDRIELLPDGRFRLLGRLDGVVKIGGKRVAVSEVERRLMQTPGVRDAAVMAVTVDSGRGAELWAAVVSDKSVTKNTLREALSRWLDPVAFPRRILFADALPREENGKLKKSNFEALFKMNPTTPTTPMNQQSPDSAAVSEMPVQTFSPNQFLDAEVIARVQAAFQTSPIPLAPTHEVPLADGKDGWCLTIPVPVDYYYFRGHFDGLPILPGVVQLDFIVRRQIARIWPDLDRGPKRIAQLKFKKTIPPGTVLRLTLERPAGTDRVHFSLACDEAGLDVCSSGRFVY